MKRSIVVSTIVVTLLLLTGRLPQSSAQVSATVTFYACETTSTGAIRMVTATTSCKTGETKISWNQVGPQGPKGATGATGAKGATGATGATGAIGAKPELLALPVLRDPPDHKDLREFLRAALSHRQGLAPWLFFRVP
jgi:hypothetical protein